MRIRGGERGREGGEGGEGGRGGREGGREGGRRQGWDVQERGVRGEEGGIV